MPCRYNQWFSVALEAYRDYFCSFRGIKRSFKLFKDQDTEFLSQLVERKYEPCDREYERGQIKSPTQHLVEGIDNLNPCAIEFKSKDEKGFGFNSVLANCYNEAWFTINLYILLNRQVTEIQHFIFIICEGFFLSKR